MLSMLQREDVYKSVKEVRRYIFLTWMERV